MPSVRFSRSDGFVDRISIVSMIAPDPRRFAHKFVDQAVVASACRLGGWQCDATTDAFRLSLPCHTDNDVATIDVQTQQEEVHWPAGCNADGRPRLESADLRLAPRVSTRDPVDKNGRTVRTPTLSRACHAALFLHTIKSFLLVVTSLN
jgi:hypothetical protein